MKHNYRILITEDTELSSLSKQKRKEILDEEIELPLFKISPDALPDKMPNNVAETTDGQKMSALEIIRPLIDEKETNHKSVISELLNGQKEKEKA